jgi:hypothetical protein
LCAQIVEQDVAGEVPGAGRSNRAAIEQSKLDELARCRPKLVLHFFDTPANRGQRCHAGFCCPAAVRAGKPLNTRAQNRT